MTPDDLRLLADVGPWRARRAWKDEQDEEWEVDGLGSDFTAADARLIALAPDLARLCAELGEALKQSRHYVKAMCDCAWEHTPEMIEEHDRAFGVLENADAALAKLAELEARP